MTEAEAAVQRIYANESDHKAQIDQWVSQALIMLQALGAP